MDRSRYRRASPLDVALNLWRRLYSQLETLMAASILLLGASRLLAPLLVLLVFVNKCQCIEEPVLYDVEGRFSTVRRCLINVAERSRIVTACRLYKRNINLGQLAEFLTPIIRVLHFYIFVFIVSQIPWRTLYCAENAVLTSSMLDT